MTATGGEGGAGIGGAEGKNGLGLYFRDGTIKATGTGGGAGIGGGSGAGANMVELGQSGAGETDLTITLSVLLELLESEAEKAADCNRSLPIRELQLQPVVKVALALVVVRKARFRVVPLWRNVLAYGGEGDQQLRKR